jgi:hypothetical protein
LEHCFHTSDFFEGAVPGHRALAQAGFLHALPDVHLLNGLGDVVEPRVVEILEDRKCLRDLQDFPQRLTSALASLRHAEAAILLVVEQLLHLDPDGDVAAFCREFARSPRPAPSNLRSSPTEFGSLAAQLAYLEHVIVPTARFFGLWFHRNLCEDLSLYLRNYDRFRGLLEFVLRKARPPEGERALEQYPAGRAQIVCNSLEGLYGNGVEDVFWEWHHLGSLDRRLPQGLAEETQSQSLSSCGMVTIVCSERQHCYKALGMLHLNQSFRHQTLNIKDSLCDPFKSGYEALHTMLIPVDSLGPRSNFLRVRITYREAQERRYQLITPGRLQDMCDQLAQRGRDREMRVFSEDGRPVLLPSGSTVLNFAHEVHDDFVGLTERAFVNRREVGLLHPLNEGDVVRLEIGVEPRPLPTQWDRKVPESTINRIKEKHNACYKPGLIIKGRKWFRKRVRERGIKQIEDKRLYDDATVDSFLEEALRSASKKQPLPIAGVAWWLRQMASPGLNLSQFGLEGSATNFLDQMAEEVAEGFRKSRRVNMEFIHVPRKLQGRFKLIIACDHCNPGVGEEIGARVDDQQQLIIHKPGCSKAVECARIVWVDHIGRGQYFVVEVSNRLGIASNILRVFSDRNVDIVEVAGAALGKGWAVMRMHVQTIGSALVNELIADIARIPGVLRVVHPNDESVPVLEGALPPREHPRIVLSTQQSPYFFGPCLPHDQYFYGRHAELSQLREFFQMISSPESQRGLMVFVKGPLKTGKSSLVSKFAREIGRISHKCTIINLTTNWKETWCQLAERLAARLVQERQLLVRDGQELDVLGFKTLPTLLHSFCHELDRTLILIVDEATSMFVNTRQVREAAALIDFIYLVESVPGVLVIWVGPEAPASALPHKLMEAIGRAYQIELRGLDYSDVECLLQAENLRYRGLRIDVDDRVTRRIFKHTRGNPYWCNILADELFKSQRVVGSRVSYHSGQVEAAKRKLSEHKIAFRGYTEDFCEKTKFQGVVPLILKILAETGTDVHVAHLAQKLRRSQQHLSRSTLNEILEQLQSRGAIRSGKSEESWQIDSAALASHILFWSD